MSYSRGNVVLSFRLYLAGGTLRQRKHVHSQSYRTLDRGRCFVRPLASTREWANQARRANLLRGKVQQGKRGEIAEGRGSDSVLRAGRCPAGDRAGEQRRLGTLGRRCGERRSAV